MGTDTMQQTIAARRKHIRDNAPCDGCGATLADCEAERGKDPTAPPWFGCCARPLLGDGDDRCHHVPSKGALNKLLDEIESGTVRTVDEVKAEAEAQRKPRGNSMSWLDYLDQGERWKPDGKPMVVIADMDPEWRFNASRFLERRAAVLAQKYTLAAELRFVAECSSPIGPSEASADSIEMHMVREADERAADPVGWIRTTALYRALVADLPDCSIALEAIKERAKHWSTCPARIESGDCRCEELRTADKAVA